MGRMVAEGKIKEGSLNPQHEKLRGRVEGKTEGGCGMGDQSGPLPLYGHTSQVLYYLLAIIIKMICTKYFLRYGTEQSIVT